MGRKPSGRPSGRPTISKQGKAVKIAVSLTPEILALLDALIGPKGNRSRFISGLIERAAKRK